MASKKQALLGVALLGATALSARANSRRAGLASSERRARSEGGRAVEVKGSDGSDRYVRVHGADDRPTIVLLHGWVETCEVWHRQVEGLSEEFRVVSYDCRGHGLSDPARDGDYSLEALAADLQLVLDATAVDGDLPLLAGHSMGAMTIAAWADAHRGTVSERARGAAFISTGLENLNTESAIVRPLPGPFGTAQGKLADVILASPGSIRQVPLPIARAVVHYVDLAPDARREDIELATRMVLDARSGARAGCSSAMSKMALLSKLDALDIPAIVVAGGKDRLTPLHHAERIDAQLPHSLGLRVSPTCGHVTPLECPELVNDALRELAAATSNAGVAAKAATR